MRFISFFHLFKITLINVVVDLRKNFYFVHKINEYELCFYISYLSNYFIIVSYEPCGKVIGFRLSDDYRI